MYHSQIKEIVGFMRVLFKVKMTHGDMHALKAIGQHIKCVYARIVPHDHGRDTF